MAAASLQGVGQPGGRAAGSLKVWQAQLTGYLYILPASILIFCFGLFPVGYALYMSTRRWRVGWRTRRHWRSLERLATA